MPPKHKPVVVTSDEVNFLVYRYLQESGENRLSSLRPPRN